MGENPPSERVFIAQLPAGLDETKFKELFGAYGTIKDVKLISGNCAIVSFASVDEAKWVVDNLDGNMPEGIGSPITAKFANPRENSWSGGGKGGGGGGGGSTAARSMPPCSSEGGRAWRRAPGPDSSSVALKSCSLCGSSSCWLHWSKLVMGRPSLPSSSSGTHKA
mmetsp:Transcript_38727/g.120465  ORF Transcript_38727/g.120465 Transcript_38727/m.120465 type:complete len:166 (+) Transcript_38727:51-548(+)